MLGTLSLGITRRSAAGLVFVCGYCSEKSAIDDEHLPALLTLEEAARIHKCPFCGLHSQLSQLIQAAD